MIAPRKIEFISKKMENENIEFHTFLKCNADENELDEKFAILHKELFSEYDCNRCRNCCKKYYGNIPAIDVYKDAEYLSMPVDEFVEIYLEIKNNNENYTTKHRPCDFLQADGSCKLGDCKPENCKKYPYTDQPERMHSLYSVLEAVSVCPVAFEIFERLKVEYGFKK